MLIDDSNVIQSGGQQNSSGTSGGAASARRRLVRDEVDEQLLPLLLEEAGELYPKICHTLSAWRAQAGRDVSLGNQLQRSLHTFKGSARMAGAMHLGDWVHRIEGRIAEAAKQSNFDNALWDDLDAYLERIASALKKLADGIAADMPQDDASLATTEHNETQQGRVPFANLHGRLYRVARQTAKELGKRVNLELLGGEIELDGGTLEKLTAPFEHLLRNAIAHGIESPEQRKRLGKTPMGEIGLSLRQEGGEWVFNFSDDGLGLDMGRLRQVALEQGLLRESEQLSEAQAVNLIFRPGLSTAQEITEIAGRGIGLDVVSAEVAALGAHLDVVSTQGKGLSFTIRLAAR